MTFNLNEALKAARAPGANDTAIDTLVKDIRSFGRDSAAGQDALPKLAYAVCRAVADGVIPDHLATNDQGKDVAHQLYVEYQSAEKGKRVHEMPTDKQTSNGLKANVSKLRQIMAMGALAHGGVIDPVDVFNRAIAARESANADGTAVKSAYPFYVDVARAQLKADGYALTDEFLKDLAAKEGKGTKDKLPAEKGLEKVRNILEHIMTGEGAYEQALSDEIENAFAAVKDALSKLHVSQAEAKVRAAAAALGLQIK